MSRDEIVFKLVGMAIAFTVFVWIRIIVLGRTKR